MKDFGNYRLYNALASWNSLFFVFFLGYLGCFQNCFPDRLSKSRMGKLVKRACAHLWYSKLDSTGNKSWSLRDWSDILYDIICICNKKLGFLILFGFHMLSNIDGLVVLPEPRDVSAEVVVLGVQHRSTIHFCWEKRLVKQSIWNSIKQARLVNAQTFGLIVVECCWITFPWMEKQVNQV